MYRKYRIGIFLSRKNLLLLSRFCLLTIFVTFVTFFVTFVTFFAFDSTPTTTTRTTTKLLLGPLSVARGQ